MKLARPPRVAVVTTTGGGAATVVDQLGLRGLECAAPGSDAPIVDLTMAATPVRYQRTLEDLLRSPECDAVLACVGSSAQFHPEFAVEPIVRAARGAKPLAAFLTPHAERSLALLAAQGIPAFRTPEACADALGAYFAWKAPKEFPQAHSPVVKMDGDPSDFFRGLGIPVAEQALARAPEFRHAIPYPVALKKIGVAHKTEVGGVILGVSEKEFPAAARSLSQPEILVQRMESGLAEAIVGYRDDPVVGPIVLVGGGGVLAELYRDFAIRTAPVSEEEAREMIDEVKGLAPIRGYRNLPRGDLGALAKAIVKISRLALVGSIAEAEINPLMVKAAGVVAVDGLVVPKE